MTMVIAGRPSAALPARMRGVMRTAQTSARGLLGRLPRRGGSGGPGSAAYFDADYYLGRYPDIARAGCSPLEHYQTHGWRECRDPNPWLSTSGYLQRYPELLVTGVDPLTHMARLCRSGRVRGATAAPRDPRAAPSLLSEVIAAQPQFPIKWRGEDYLATGLSDLQRARSQLHSFALLDALFPPAELRALLFDGLALWRTDTAAGAVEIRLARARAANEGELALSCVLAGQTLALLSFNVFPAEPRAAETADRLFIGRMQTTPAGRAAARPLGRALSDVTLQACLFAALQGVGEALGIAGFIGTPAARQVSLHLDPARGVGAYDLFFESVGARVGADGLYHGRLRGEVRPLAEVKPGHKIRTRRKRALKQTIAASARAVLEVRKSGQDQDYRAAA